VVCISSISAFKGCRSLYGQAKLEIEKIARSFGALTLRPGLIHGEPPAGMFGRLVHQVEHSRVLPLAGGGRQIQYLVHDSDICALVARFGAGALAVPADPVTLAHEQPWTFRQILEAIARARGKKLRFVPLPWRLLWTAIKCAEAGGIRLGFRSDSLVSLMYQNPNPSFALARELGAACRPFRV
jgi:nucleoside-diphosphate-sugar epimerase